MIAKNEPRRRTSFGGSGGSSDDDDPINPDDDDPPNTPVARARRIPADFDYDRSFKQSVAFYGLIGGCDGPSTQPEREAFKRCTKACTTTACLNDVLIILQLTVVFFLVTITVLVLR